MSTSDEGWAGVRGSICRGTEFKFIYFIQKYVWLQTTIYISKDVHTPWYSIYWSVAISLSLYDWFYFKDRPRAGQFLARFSSAQSESNLWSRGSPYTHFILGLFWWFLPINFPFLETTILTQIVEIILIYVLISNEQWYVAHYILHIIVQIFQNPDLNVLMSCDVMISISQYFNLGTSQYQTTFHSPHLGDFLMIFPLCFSRVLITSAGVQCARVELPKRNASWVRLLWAKLGLFGGKYKI